jgi:hypothetical protein
MPFSFSFGNALACAASHPLTVALLVIAFCLILFWVSELFTHRLSTLAGLITIQGEPLPSFSIDAQTVGASRFWRLQQACEGGTFALYDVPVGQLKLDLSFGPADSCKFTATVAVSKGRNLFDLDLSLELDRLDVQRQITAGAASSTVVWTFRKPTSSPPTVPLTTTSLQLHYSISHAYKDALGAAQIVNIPASTWSMPAPPALWEVAVPIPNYRSAGEVETWSVEVYADGFPDIKRVSKTKK